MKVGSTSMEEMWGTGFAGRSPPLERERHDGSYGTAFYLKNPTPPGAAQEVPVTSEPRNRKSKDIETVS